MRARQITAAEAHHGEGAFWDEERSRLLFVDMLRGDVATVLPTGDVSRRHVGDVACVIRRRESGGYLVAAERAVLTFDELWRLEDATSILRAADMRLNEGGCDPQGRFYIGSMQYQVGPRRGSLSRVDPDMSVTEVIGGLTIPNGLVWSSDGRQAFHSETGSATITRYVFDSTDGTFSEGEVIVDLSEEDGSPDGMAIDTDGALWVAIWGGGQVRRYSGSGLLEEVVEVPGVTNVTSCAFGGEKGTTVFITTSAVQVDRAAEPGAGAVFAVDVGVSGAPIADFAG